MSARKRGPRKGISRLVNTELAVASRQIQQGGGPVAPTGSPPEVTGANVVGAKVLSQRPL